MNFYEDIVSRTEAVTMIARVKYSSKKLPPKDYKKVCDLLAKLNSLLQEVSEITYGSYKQFDKVLTDIEKLLNI